VAISAHRRYADVIAVAGEQAQLDEEGKREVVEFGRRYFERAPLCGSCRSRLRSGG
jgi:tRNA(Ile2) C34 agmatinyltransferase TiaS